MIEIFQIKRNLALITVEGLREYLNAGVEYTYEFKLTGFTPQKMPHYIMFIYINGAEHILCSIKNTTHFPPIRTLNLFSAVITLHQEFGLGKPLCIETNKNKIYTLEDARKEARGL